MYLFNTKYNIKQKYSYRYFDFMYVLCKNELMFQYVCRIGFYFITFVFKK